MSFQTPGGPAAKRRRIEAANATLRKPFRSPLVNRQQEQEQNNPNLENSPAINRSPATTAASTIIPHTLAPVRASRHFSTTASPLTKEQQHQPSNTSHTKPYPKPKLNITDPPTPATTTSSKPTPTPAGPRHRQPDPDNLLARLATSQRALATQVRAAQAQLAIVRQARQIEEASLSSSPSGNRLVATAAAATTITTVGRGGGEDGSEGEGREVGVVVGGELTGLVGMWKGASRIAAEELFELVKRRVEGMGDWRGLGGGWEEDSDGGERKGGRDEDGIGDEDEDGERRVEGKEVDEGEDFTMLKMLKSLNIDPDVLGYDPVEDKWRD